MPRMNPEAMNPAHHSDRTAQGTYRLPLPGHWDRGFESHHSGHGVHASVFV
jgi:hypothetical protein